MGNTLKFNSSVCTSIEQSQRLLDLGLKPETADMSIITTPIDCDGIKYSLTPYSKINHPKVFGAIPAWSLHRLIEMFHENILITKSNYIVVDNIFDFDASGNLYDNLISAFQHFFPEQYLNE